MRVSISRIVALAAIPFLIYMIYIAGSWGVADVYARPAMSVLEKWRAGKIKLNGQDWDEIQANLSKALQHDPDNPDIHEYLALALEGALGAQSATDEEVISSRKAAYSHYKKSIAVRPTWPYAWVNLALVKYRLGEIDDEFFNAYKKAEQLGPWEPGVQKIIIEIGLHGWARFSQQDRLSTLDMISRAMEHTETRHSQNILQMVDQYGFLDYVCLLNKERSRVVDYCKKHKKN